MSNIHEELKAWQEMNETIMEEIILSLYDVLPSGKYNQLVYVYSKMTGKTVDYKPDDKN